MKSVISKRLGVIASLSALLSIGCGGDEKKSGPKSGDECDLAAPECIEGEVCEELVDGTARCFAPVWLRGKVVDSVTLDPIEGAVVQAMDANEAPQGSAARTDENGAYELTIAATRDEEGTPAEGKVTLRAQAMGYELFPTPIRPALPVDAALAVEHGDDGYLLESTATEIRLLPLEGDTQSLGSISGAVLGDTPAGVLVVAEGAATPLSGMSDGDGEYVIFNVPQGSYTVSGYAAGVELVPQSISLTAGEEKADVDLEVADKALSTVSGKVEIVNAPGGSVTSVVLVLESTFAETTARGIVPPGLRAAGVTGTFSIEGVPDGRYVVLAAFENDGLVRDPDETIGGTQIVRIAVQGADVPIAEGFKVTGALAVVSPGAEEPEQVSGIGLTFRFADDSSEDGYLVKLFDAFGEKLWETELPGVSGSDTVDVAYDGPALEQGMFYQFRAWSWRDKKGAQTFISATEDLRGVFYL